MELQLSEGSLTTFQVLTLPFNCAWWVHLIWSGNLVVDCPGKRGGGGKVSRLNQVNLTRYSPGLVHWQLKGREINPWCPKVSFDFLCINKKERKQDDMATCDHWSTMVWSYLLGVDGQILRFHSYVITPLGIYNLFHSMLQKSGSFLISSYLCLISFWYRAI